MSSEQGAVKKKNIKNGTIETKLTKKINLRKDFGSKVQELEFRITVVIFE